MEALDAMLFRNGTRHERNQRATGLTETSNPPNRASEKPRWENARSLIHRDGVHGPQKHADEGYRNGVADKRWDKPNHKLEAGDQWRQFQGLWRQGEGRRKLTPEKGARRCTVHGVRQSIC